MGFFDEPTTAYNFPDGRVEAIAKVTGKGTYSAEFRLDNICYGILVGSTIPAGKIRSFQLSDAMQSSGVIDIITHLNKPVVPGLSDEAKIKDSRLGLPVFHTDTIYFKGQPIALVLAETLEEAMYAASLVTASYTSEKYEVDFYKSHPSIPLKPTGKERGNVDSITDAKAIVNASYTIRAEVHNPMEMHATIAHWTATDKLSLYDKNQGVNSVQRTMAKLFDIPTTNIEVSSEYVGGGFGSGLRVWSNTVAAAMGAKQVKRPVKLMLTRSQMFTLVGYRPASWQHIQLGAYADGKFAFIKHQAKHGTSVYENFNEGITRITRLVYQFDHLKAESAIVPLNLSTPTWMRGPGDCTGDFAVECAIDELSEKLALDPVDIRIKNLSIDKDPETGKPWSTHFLKECIEIGAEKIGWRNRKAAPGMITEGDWSIGYGMAVGMWNAGRGTASAAIEMQKDGSILVKSAMTDIGTGTGAAMQNIAHDSTGISTQKIKVALGHSDLPPAPSQGGSTGLSSISGAVTAAANRLKEKLAGYAAINNTIYQSAAAADILLSDTGISYQTPNNSFVSYAAIWEKNKLDTIEVEASSGPGAERAKYAFCSSAAHFCRVKVHRKTGKVTVDKMVCVVDGGKIVNEKPAANQISGAAVGGIGMALMEEMIVDADNGGLIGNDFTGYHVAVNADAPIIEVSFINKPDVNINPSGAKGLGEVGIIGAAPAIANAIYNATGKRCRDLPITPDKLL